MSASCPELDNSARKRFKVLTREEIPEVGFKVLTREEEILEVGFKAAKLNCKNVKIFQPDKEYIAVIAQQAATSSKAIITQQPVISSEARFQLETEIKTKIHLIELKQSYYMMLGYIMAVVSSPDTSPGACDACDERDECDDEVADICSTSNLIFKNMTPLEIRNNLTSVIYSFLNQNQNLAELLGITKDQVQVKLLKIAQARAQVLREASKEVDLLNKFIELMHLLIR